MGNAISEGFGDFTSATGAGTHLSGGANLLDFEDWRLDPEASDDTTAGSNSQVLDLLYQPPAPPIDWLGLGDSRARNNLGK